MICAGFGGAPGYCQAGWSKYIYQDAIPCTPVAIALTNLLDTKPTDDLAQRAQQRFLAVPCEVACDPLVDE